MAKTALIVGHAGQDGFYLSEHLKTLGYQVIGVSRRTADLDTSSSSAVFEFLKKHHPDEIYYLAAHHHSSEQSLQGEIALYEKSFQTHAVSLSYFLEGMKSHLPKCRLFYAGSSHVFGSPSTSPQDESTPFAPECIYGITKVAGIELCRFFRRDYGVYAAVGVLYNHESPRRAGHFVSSKIVNGAVQISRGKQSKLVLGSLESTTDWGYAPDYVEAMQKILQSSEPTEFVVSSGKAHTVKDFVAEAFGKLGLRWEDHVEVSAALVSKKPKKNLLGNPEKLQRITGWRPKVPFEKMVHTLVEQRLQLHE